MLRLSADEVEAALYCVADTITRRKLAGRNTPTEVVALYRLLADTSRHAASSAAGTGKCCREGPLNDEHIDSTAAASILGCSARRVRTIATDLDGQRVGTQWVFPRSAVLSYAEAKRRRPA